MRLKGAAAYIPEVPRVSLAQCVQLAAYNHRAAQTEDCRAVEILVVFHDIEGESCMKTRCWQGLEEGAVRVIGGVRIAAAKRVPSAKPRIQGADRRLPAEFPNKRPGALS